MNKTVRQNYERLAQAAGLRFDPRGGGIYGQRGEFELTVTAENPSYPNLLTVTVPARRTVEPLTKEECKQFRKDNKAVLKLEQKDDRVTMSLRSTSNQTKLQENLNEALQALVNFLRVSGFQNCCQTCGKVGETAPCYCGGGYLHLCPDCFVALQQNKAVSREHRKQKKENLIGGIVGALIGSLLGVLCIVLLSQLGYVAALSGVVMAVCTLKGYEMLGGKLTNKGIVISIIVMIVMTYVGDRADWAILVARDLEIDFITGFRAVPLLLKEELIEASSYWGNLVLLYVFMLLGAVPTISGTVKSQKNRDQIYCLKELPMGYEEQTPEGGE